MDMGVWIQKCEEVVDQRDKRLPPTWCEKASDGRYLAEAGHEVYESGKRREMADRALELLGRAQEIAIVCSFLLADKAIEDALEQAASRGVRVYVLLASEARLKQEPRDGEFEKQVREQHESLLKRLGGLVMFRSAANFHAKLVLVDPYTKPDGMLLTANLTTDALQRNEEIGVALTPDEAFRAFEYLRWAIWEAAEHQMLDNSRFVPVKPLGEIDHPSGTGRVLVTTAQEQSIKVQCLRLIEQAESKILISSFGWDKEGDLVKTLCRRARDGLDVVVLARQRPASMPALIELARSGAKVFGFKWLHAKAIWTDRKEGVVMSANFQAEGLDHGFELGVALDAARAESLCQRLMAWKQAASWQLLVSPVLGELQGQIKVWDEKKFVDATIESELEQKLDRVTADSADRLECTRPGIPVSAPFPAFAHQVRYVWEVVAPELKSGSKPYPSEKQKKKATKATELPVYEEPGKRRVVCVKSSEELQVAQRLMQQVKAQAIVVDKRPR